VNGAPVAGVLPVSAEASCPGVVAHIVREQVMATHVKSKMAANLLRLGFIDFSLGLEFSVFTSARCLIFGSRTNVFLSGKAESAVKTRQVFVDALRRAEHFQAWGLEAKTDALPTDKAQAERSLLLYTLWPGSTIPATFSNPLVLRKVNLQGLMRARLIRGWRISSCALTF
jgi:hypothetical protein